MIIHGDCIEVMAGMEPESVDAIVCDPPYGLEFMGKEWDRLDWRDGGGFSKPGLGDRPTAWTSFGGETANATCSTCGGRMRGARKCGCAEPDWRVKGAPMTDRATARSRTMQDWHFRWAEAAYRVAKPSAYLLAFGGTRTVHRLACAIEDAGWIIRDTLVWAYASGFPKSKASLKPAWEPIVMARKPGPLRELAIDLCRIGFASDADREDAEALQRLRNGHPGVAPTYGGGKGMPPPTEVGVNPAGRWPANLLLTDPIFDGGVEGVVGGGEANRWFSAPRRGDGKAVDGTVFTEHAGDGIGYGDSGTYSRFFLIPKADRADREPVVKPDGHDVTKRFTTHPTVKPTELMRHLVRLVTPTGGTVLDPFLGSGTTGIAAELEGFPWVGIEREAEYVAIAEARLNGTQRGLGLDVPAPVAKRSTGGSLEEIRAKGTRHAVNDPAARSQKSALFSGLVGEETA